MKACIIQPPYSRDLSRSDELFQWKLDELDRCDNSVDLIVLPEYSDVPCATATKEETFFYHKKYMDRLMEKCVETAKRCNALVFVNALSDAGDSYRNTTFAINQRGETVGKYDKKHLPPLELNTLALDSRYTFEYSEPYVLEIDGLRYGFLTCYDFYFYEAFANIARQNVDIIIGCSLQRSDTHDAIETMCRFAAYQTNAYVLRSSVSFAEDSEICGASMVVSPHGKVLRNLKGKFGSAVVEFDPTAKYYKPAGFGNPDAAHHEYIEFGRKPWQYRPAGSAIVNGDGDMPYPRICAHRGFSAIAPENSLPAFGTAIAMGAEEIEFDLWATKDRQWVSIHDCRLERVSNGTGYVWEHTLAELKELDFGSCCSDKFKNLRIPTFEEILKKFSCHTVMNIHLKSLEEEFGRAEEIYDDRMLCELIALIDRYDCRKYVYFMTVSDALHARLAAMAPDIPRCMGENFDHSTDIVDRALRAGCRKVQLYKGEFTRETVEKAHHNGLICNVFWSDDPVEAQEYLDMGIETVLTNDYHIVANGIRR